MVSPGKRSYSSDLRAAQARRTRRQIVEAAATLFADRGYVAATIDAIAAAAGVSRKTVFASVGGKADLIKLAYDFAVTGDDEPVPMRDRPAIKALEAETDPRRLLSGFAAVITEACRRTAPVFMALQAAAEVDLEAGALFATMQQQRLDAMRAPAKLLAGRRALKRGVTVDMAVDILWIHNDPSLYHKLVLQRGWSTTRFQDWLAAALCAQLLKSCVDQPASSLK